MSQRNITAAAVYYPRRQESDLLLRMKVASSPFIKATNDSEVGGAIHLLKVPPYDDTWAHLAQLHSRHELGLLFLQKRLFYVKGFVIICSKKHHLKDLGKLHGST